jgi:curli production assembly/transport component CsgG
MTLISSWLLPVLATGLAGCTDVVSMVVQPPNTQEQSAAAVLRDLPVPTSQALIVGVYKFDDQTGQRAMTERPVAEMSSAIPQGLASLLIQELSTVGHSKFFRVVERETVEDLLNERRIVAAMLGDGSETELQALLLPGVLITGGAVSYDRKIVQEFAGLGAASINARREIISDRVGIVLRAVSVQNGEVLESIYVSKEVKSQVSGISGVRILGTDVGAAELGLAENEPVSLAVRMAIAAGVNELVLRGIARDWWKVKPAAPTPE